MSLRENSKKQLFVECHELGAKIIASISRKEKIKLNSSALKSLFLNRSGFFFPPEISNFLSRSEHCAVSHTFGQRCIFIQTPMQTGTFVPMIDLFSIITQTINRRSRTPKGRCDGFRKIIQNQNDGKKATHIVHT